MRHSCLFFPSILTPILGLTQTVGYQNSGQPGRTRILRSPELGCPIIASMLIKSLNLYCLVFRCFLGIIRRYWSFFNENVWILFLWKIGRKHSKFFEHLQIFKDELQIFSKILENLEKFMKKIKHNNRIKFWKLKLQNIFEQLVKGGLNYHLRIDRILFDTNI